MIETELGNLRRSHYSDQINSSMDGVEVTVMGWILTVRGHEISVLQLSKIKMELFQ